MTSPEHVDLVQPAGGWMKWRSVLLVTLCVVLPLSLWFSMTAVVPALKVAFGISDSRAALLASSVSFGFVIGTLISALLNVADRFDPRRLFAASALIAASANAAILLVTPDTTGAIVLRLVTGACMAGIYPVGMRMVASWAGRDTGVLLGFLTGAMCAGSGLPHLVDALVGLNWQITIGIFRGNADGATDGCLAYFTDKVRVKARMSMASLRGKPRRLIIAAPG